MFKPMSDSAIKAEVFATVKVKKKAAASTPKPRTVLLQEGKNNVTATSQVIDYECSSKNTTIRTFEDVSNGVIIPVSIAASSIPRNATKDDVMISSPCESSGSYYDDQESAAMAEQISSMQFGLECEFVKHNAKEF
jgi:hypothetical protein